MKSLNRLASVSRIVNYIEYVAPQTRQRVRSRRITQESGNFPTERKTTFSLSAHFRAIDQRKDVSAFTTQTLKRAEAKPEECSLVRFDALALEVLQQIRNQFVIGGRRQFGEIMKRQRSFAQRRIDAARS